ncbi:uncharacterized protein [Leptinotarsa decemlineata]|uniref:uncharacterized protein n=1 Tax=Leptinotarsa decemlineata TaxID=7539 RepID=UPI003D306FE1
MASSSCKKKASPFSKEEELRLVEKINEERKFIENKETNKVSNTAKEMAWVRICASFNTNTLEFRGVDQLKSKYDNLKTKTRKQVAKEKKYEKGTGVGFFIPKMDDPVMDMILKIVNAKTVVGLTNPNDDDNANETILEKMDEDLKEDSDVSLIEPPLLNEKMEVVLAEELPSEEVQIAKPSCHQKLPSKNVLRGKKNLPGCFRNVS